MKGFIVRNRYYTDEGMEYAFKRLCSELDKRGAACCVVSPRMCFCRDGSLETDIGCGDFAVFWDKDTVLCSAVQKKMRCFNNARAIEVCDDKVKTYAALEGIAPLPRSIPSPLMYASVDATDDEYLSAVASLGFPLVLKERVGSRGEQVHLVTDADTLSALYAKLRHVPHMCEEYVEGGEHDVRIYVIGGSAAGSVSRDGMGFRSNVYMGASVKRAAAPAELVSVAEKAAAKLNLDYCAVDFIGKKRPVLIEVNSNAYFTGAEACGIDIAGRYADYITEACRAGR